MIWLFFFAGLNKNILDRYNFVEIFASLHQRENEDLSGTYIHCFYAAKSHMLV